MNTNASVISKQRISSAKNRRFQPVSFIKKLRSKIPRRKRFQISPILGESSSNSLFGDNESELSVFPVVSSSSCFPDEISSSSNWISVGTENFKKFKSSRRKRQAEITTENRADVSNSRQLEKIPGEDCRTITRSYYRQKVSEKAIEKGNGGGGAELSETYSCVESFSGAEARTLSRAGEFPERNLIWKSRAPKVAEQAGENEGDTASAGVISLSETSCIQTITQEKSRKNFKSDEVSGEISIKRAKKSVEIQGDNASEVCFLKSPYESKDQNLVGDSLEKTTKEEENRVPDASFSEISRNYVELNLESTANQKPNDLEFDYALACSEDFSYEEGSDDSTIYPIPLSDLDSDIFPSNSDVEFSDYTKSLFESQSPSDFSAGNSYPTAYFSLLLQYTKQFFKLSSSSPDHSKVRLQVQDEYFDEFTFLRFEDEIHEESYKKFRSRERREVVLRDYINEYFSTSEYGDLVLEQRMVMVNWIIEESNVRELNLETTFLGVSLLDRFLNKGFFKNKRKLQVLGIACLTLATRIEENQPLNSVRQRTFHVGSNAFSRCEVVAMEWLVQEVLHFQCFLPTTYNFLWFYLEAAKADREMEETAKYLAVLSLLNHEHLRYWPSTIAAGLVILSALAAKQDPSCLWVIESQGLG
ncbi:Cyclin [Macleaya cordata]|uniref:Cyclin n=1 Tax=Macleaya cordata TaxID=56857 RepID=A0A200QTV7_MACCD|nr:Cyclin [Macleaya cordata]OVA15311.1 Cyclin [Macleaya cordata]